MVAASTTAKKQQRFSLMVVLKTAVSTTTKTSEGLSCRIRLNAGSDYDFIRLRLLVVLLSLIELNIKKKFLIEIIK
jgi:hypothetical protein